MGYLTFAITCIYFYLPVAAANMGANIAKYIPVFRDIKFPIDFGIKINGIRIVGDHKNFGGFSFGVVFGSIFGIVKTILVDPRMTNYLLLDTDNIKLIVLYVLMSVAALSGDLIKSLFKRLFNQPPHSPWIPFDEIDHSLTSMLVAKLLFPISWTVVSFIVIVLLFLHLITNVIGYLLKIRDVPY